MSPSASIRFGALLVSLGMACATSKAHCQEANSAGGGTVRIVTTTTGGLKVWAKVKQRKINGEVTDASYIRRTKGLAEVFVSNCDQTLFFNAYTTTLSVNNPVGERWLPCRSPEVTFSDFELMSATIFYDNDQYSDPAVWKKAFGDSVLDLDVPTDLAQAFANREYGRVSIIGTELNQQFRTAGRDDQADFFYALAVDAGARGAAAKLGLLIEDGTLETTTLYNDRLELTAQAKDWVGQYQMMDLGAKSDTKDLGKVDWKTMRSLPGGADVNVAKYDVPFAAIAEFDTEVLLDFKKGM